LWAADEPAAKVLSDTWQVIHMGDARIGYARSTTSAIESEGKKVLRTETETHMVIKRFGQELKMQTVLHTDETEDGEVLSFVFEMRNPPAGSTRTVGKVEGNTLKLETYRDWSAEKRGPRQTTTIPWDPEVRAPAYQDRILQEAKLKPGDVRSFKVFLPEYNKVTDVKLAAADPVYTSLLDGKQHQLLKVNVTQSLFPTMPMRAYLDESGETVKSEADFLGTAMATYAVSKEEALKSIAGSELDLAVNTLVRVLPIRHGHETKRVVYRIHTPGEDPALYLVDGGTQQVKRIDEHTVELTITSVKPASGARNADAVPPEYLASTQYLEIKDAKVAEHARQAAFGLTDPVLVAFRMEKYVHEKLTAKNFSTALASAGEVAAKLEGDCTEHAVLLAAMLRARGIPSRITVGLVYIEGKSCFGGHMWTEALLGDQWIPLDATLGRGGIGAAHIKLAESSFADDAPAPITTFVPLLKILGNIQIDVVQAE
jgi:hypothetical protein